VLLWQLQANRTAVPDCTNLIEQPRCVQIALNPIQVSAPLRTTITFVPAKGTSFDAPIPNSSIEPMSLKASFLSFDDVSQRTEAA
jgi:hypothetical protein